MKKFLFLFFFSFFIILSFVSSTITLNDVVSYYPLDEENENITSDDLGSNDGIPFNFYVNFQNASGRFNYSYNFRFDDNYSGVWINNSNLNNYISKDKPFSIAFWTSINDLNAQFKCIFCNTNDPQYHNQKGFSIFQHYQALYINLNAGNGAGQDEIQASANSIFSIALPLEYWYFVVVNYNGNGSAYGLEVWVNGEKITLNVDFDNLNSEFTNTEVPFLIGNMGYITMSGYPASTPPVLDEIYIFNRTLTEEEVIFMNNTDTPIFEGSLLKLGDVPNQNLSYEENISIDFNDYFSGWYDIAVISTDPESLNKTQIITGVYRNYYPFYHYALNSEGILGYGSFNSNYNDTIDAFACDNSTGGIDYFCPLEGYPSTCNISAFYTSPYCISSTFNISILGNTTPVVEVVNPFSLWYRIDDYDDQYFIFSNYFANFNNIEVKYLDFNLNKFYNQTLSCNLDNPEILSLNGFYNVTLECGYYNAWLRITSNNYSGNYTFYVNASNSISYLTDYFRVSTGDIEVSTEPLNIWNFKDLKYLFPEISSSSHSYIVGIIFIIALLVIGIMFIGVPLKFSTFSLFIIAVLFLFAVWLMAWVGYIPYLWLIILVVLFIFYLVIKFIYRGN